MCCCFLNCTQRPTVSERRLATRSFRMNSRGCKTSAPTREIRLDTLRALHERDHKLAAYCPTCRRWTV